MSRLFVTTSLLLLTSTAAFADQAYIQSAPWVVSRLPVMEGQDFHQRCMVQASFTGTASVQFIAEGKKLRGAVFILTEPVFKEEGRSLDITLTAGGKSFEFPARTMSKYALAIEISETYADKFQAALKNAELVRLKSGFNTYNFSIQLPKAPVDEAIACAPLPQAPVPKNETPVALRQTAMLNEAVSQQPPAGPPANLVPLPEDIDKVVVTPQVIQPGKSPDVQPLPSVVPDPMAKPAATPVETPAAPPAPVIAEPAAPKPLTPEAGATATHNVVIGSSLNGDKAPKAHIVNTDGNNVVLSEALPLIMPQGYTFKMAQGASPGERISWHKGEDWMDTLIVALDAADLQAAVSNRTVTVLPKLKPVTMEVAGKDVSPPHGNVIVKENALLPMTDPRKPPSPGMKDEAASLLANMRLDEKTLSELLGQPTPAQAAADDFVPLVAKDKAIPSPKVDLSDVVSQPDLGKAEIPTYAAGKGESMKAVLSRWSEKSGRPTDVELQRDYFLTRPINVEGDYDLAISQLIGQFQDIPDAPRVSDEADEAVAASGDLDTGGATGSVKGQAPKSVLRQDKDDEGEALPPQQKAVPPAEDVVETRLGLVSRWEASRNTSLRSALSNWARQSQMQLVWNAGEDLTIPQTIKSTARFEDALEKLLSQYDSAAERPVIQINRDPDSGLMAMIVDIEKDKPAKE